MQVCPHCGRESRDFDRYCLHCGQRMDVPAGVDAMPSYSAIPPSRGGAAPVSGADMRGALGKRAVAAGAKNPPPAVTPRGTAGARLVLKPREGEQDGPREYPLDGRDVVIGRAPSCDIVLPSDQLASRRHSQLEFDGVTYTIRDLGSSNGTYVNGDEIHQAMALKDGDRITVGEHDLVFAVRPVLNTDGFPVPIPPPWPPISNGAAGQPAGPTEKHSAVSSARNEAPPGHLGATAAATARPATGTPLGAGGDAGDIEQLHKLLVDASAGMVRRAEAAERQVAELRAMLMEMERQVSGALGMMASNPLAGRAGQLDPEAAVAAERQLDELVRLSRAAADNPRLDHVSALAARASDVSDALEAVAGLARTFGDWRVRLTELTAEPADEPE
jgi:FHA domain